MSFIIRGVHEVDAPEPCYLIEAELTDGANFDWGSVTANRPESIRGATIGEKGS